MNIPHNFAADGHGRDKILKSPWLKINGVFPMNVIYTR